MRVKTNVHETICQGQILINGQEGPCVVHSFHWNVDNVMGNDDNIIIVRFQHTGNCPPIVCLGQDFEKIAVYLKKKYGAELVRRMSGILYNPTIILDIHYELAIRMLPDIKNFLGNVRVDSNLLGTQIEYIDEESQYRAQA